MNIRHTDKIYASVQSAVERKIRRLRIHIAFILIAARNHQKVFSLLFAQIGNVRPECGISAFMVNRFLAVYINGSLLPGSQNLHVNPSTAKRLYGRLKAPGIPAFQPGIASVPVLAVNGVPAVGKVNLFPIFRQMLRQSGILFYEAPVPVQVN